MSRKHCTPDMFGAIGVVQRAACSRKEKKSPVIVIRLPFTSNKCYAAKKAEGLKLDCGIVAEQSSHDQSGLA